jgi:hypothetical protein
MSLFRNLGFIATGTRHFTKEGYLRQAKNFDNRCVHPIHRSRWHLSSRLAACVT